MPREEVHLVRWNSNSGHKETVILPRSEALENGQEKSIHTKLLGNGYQRAQLPSEFLFHQPRENRDIHAWHCFVGCDYIKMQNISFQGWENLVHHGS
jgi:hypothetical protein